MNSAQANTQEGRLSVPFILLTLSLLALVLSSLEVQRTSEMADERLSEIQSVWSQVQNGAVEGSDIVEISSLMRSLQGPVPAAKSAGRWSLALALVSSLLFLWLAFAVRKDYLERLAASSEQTDQGNMAIAKLADEIAPLAIGDLRVQPTVDTTIAAPVADIVNQLVSDLRWLVTTIIATARQINLSVSHNERMVRSVADTTASQSETIRESSNFLSSMTGALGELSAASSERAAMARTISERATRGRLAVAANISRINRIGSDVEALNHSLTSIASTLHAVVEQVTGIQDIAKRTDLLALNATISMTSRSELPGAARDTSEAEGNVGLLSDEVAHLSDYLGQAAREVKLLVRSMSRETAKTVEASQLIIGEIENARMVTADSAELLTMLAGDAISLENTFLGFSETTVQHSGTVRQIIENLDNINRLAQESASIVSAESEALGELAELSTELQNAVIEFKMPGSVETSGRPTLGRTAARRAADRAVIHG
ncbi:MAG: methyl-accepting chemotaxis protein [Granulosicoccus sp.]